MGIYDSEEDLSKVSKINSAALINFRMDALWKEVNKFAASGRFLDWNIKLDRIWCELSGDAKDEDFEAFNELNLAVSETGKLFDGADDGFNEPKKESLDKRAIQYKKLIDKEIFLRKLMNKQGKGTAYYDGSEDYMD